MAHAPVSVVVPMRNEAMTVAALLEGLARQVVLPSEITFVDTGSTDGSAERVRSWWVASGWSGTSCNVIVEPGVYPGAARNAGIRASHEPWIAFIDCGIVPDPGWLKALLECAREAVPGVLGFCRFGGVGPWERAFCALSYGVGTRRMVLPSSLFHRSVFDRVGLFDPSLRSGEDLLWLQKLRAIEPAIASCPAAEVSYSSLPSSPVSAIRKYFDYERSISSAGIGGWRRRAISAGPLLLYILPIVDLTAGGVLWAVYFALRVVVDPVRRSKTRMWWRGAPLSFLAVLPAALALDTGRAMGSLAGIASRAPRG